LGHLAGNIRSIRLSARFAFLAGLFAGVMLAAISAPAGG
jgi:hypothetical protein